MTILPRDNLTAKWLSDMAKRLSELETPQLILPQRPVQKLTHEAELDQIVATLMTFPRIRSDDGGRDCQTGREFTGGVADAGGCECVEEEGSGRGRGAKID